MSTQRHSVPTALTPYATYKHVGALPYLGEVPASWKVVPLYAIARPKTSTSSDNRELLSVYLGRGVIPFSEVAEKRTNPTSEDLSRYQAVDPGDFVLNNQQAWRGSVGVSRYRGIVSPAYLVLTLNGRLSREFADRLLSDRAMVTQYLVCSKGVGSIQRNLYWPYLKRVSVLAPPEPDQAAIVRFLAHIDSRIRRYMASKRRLIAALTEQRASVIHHAVTRGLAKGVRLRPSGVEWIGDVPDHWQVKRIRHLAHMLVSSVDKHIVEGETAVRLCNYVDVYKHETIRPDMPFMRATATASEVARFRLNEDDVLITKDSEDWKDIGVPAHVVQSGPDLLCGYHLAILRPRPGLLGRYLYRQLQSPLMRVQFSVRANGVTRYGLSHGAIKDALVLQPPMPEQTAIVAFLDEATADLDKAIAAGKSELDLLREYRARLIGDVVTGKVDVREVASTLPDEGIRSEEHPGDFAEIGADLLEDEDVVAEETEA